MKACGGEIYIWCSLDANPHHVPEPSVKRKMSRRPPNISPDTDLSSPNTSQFISNTDPHLVSEEFLSLLSSLMPLLSPTPLQSPLQTTLQLSPSPSESGSGSPPSLSPEETHDIIFPPQVANETDTTIQVDASSLEPLSTNLGATIGSGPIQTLYNNRPSYHTLSFFVLWLTRWVEAGNAYLGTCLHYGGGYTRTFLNRIFTLHPILPRVYLIVESASVSLHPTTLLLACLLYIQEVILLASQMEPAIVA